MPAYDYTCEECGFHETLVHPMSECGKDIKCPQCEKANLQRIFHAVPVRFIGSDWPDVERKKKEGRFKKRNARLEAMDEPHKKRMTKFMSKYGVKKSY